MTPLEKAKQKEEQGKSQPACKDCHKSERLGNLLYCQISGKIIMPQYENISCCRGERLKGGDTLDNIQNKTCKVLYYDKQFRTKYKMKKEYIFDDPDRAKRFVKERESEQSQYSPCFRTGVYVIKEARS